MRCKICNTELREDALFCPKCGSKISDMAGSREWNSTVLPVKWMYGFALVPNLFFAIANAGYNVLINANDITAKDASESSARWFWVMMFLSLFFKILFIARDHNERKMRNMPVKVWTWAGLIMSPIFILGRDKFSKHTLAAMILWLIVFVVAIMSV